MDSSYTAIRNYEALVKFLGKWPSFDDFEVGSMLLKRSGGELAGVRRARPSMPRYPLPQGAGEHQSSRVAQQ